MALDQEMSPERNQAYHKMRQAQVEEQKHHLDKAIALAKEGLHVDPTYAELRFWLAQVYERNQEPRKASPEYQELIHQDRGNEAAWEHLRRVDPAAADRLDRLTHLAPDPFVAKHNIKAGASEDDLLLEDVEGFGQEMEELGGDLQYEGDTELADLEEVEGEFDPLLQGADGIEEKHGDVFADDDDLGLAGDDALLPEDVGVAPEPVVAQTAEVAVVTPPPPAPEPEASDAYPWEHEQDRPFRAKLMQWPAFAFMVERIEAAWEQEDEWEIVHGHLAHADHKQHPELFQAAHDAAVRLTLSKPELYLIPERFTQPEVFRGTPLQIAVPTGILRGFSTPEKQFTLGRWLGTVACGQLAHMQASHVVIERKVRIEDCAMAVRERLEGITRGWKDHVEKDQIPKLKAMCHAWEQRAVLSSDRAGLVACSDLEASCRAIAKSTVKYADDAMKLSTEAFLRDFDGQDVGGLAAIPVEDSPCSSKPYAAYRIAMLRWWASTPEGQAQI
jgi:hypothetical protein